MDAPPGYNSAGAGDDLSGPVYADVGHGAGGQQLQSYGADEEE